jgi:hypothetical protein
MKRIAVFLLLALLSFAAPTPAKTQGMTGAEYGRRTWAEAKIQQKKQKKAMKKEVKRQRKAAKRILKAQRKQEKQANRHIR